MAEIPVTKKSGIPWWVWALLAAVVLIGLFLLLGGDDDAAVADAAPAEVARTADADGVIVSLATIERGSADLAGRQVDIDGLTVERMHGDRTFSVTDGTASVFVVLDEVVPGPDSGADGDVNVDAGQTIDLDGEVFAVEDGMIDGQRIQDMPPGTRLYVFAREVAIGG